MKTFNLLVSGLLLISYSGMLSASDTPAYEFAEFDNPKKFKDIRSADENRTKFQHRLNEKLNKFVGNLSKELPDGYRLKLVFTDIDLAGRVEYLFDASKELRVIRDIDIPRLDFKAQVTANGELVYEQDVKLKDMAFMSRHVSLGARHDTLRYEKRMLKAWFEDELKPELNNNQGG